MKRSYSQMKGSTSSKTRKKKRVVPVPVPQKTFMLGKSLFSEVKLRDQILAVAVQPNLVTIDNLVYVEPTVAGLGLATGYTCLNCVSQGTTVAQRIGNKIRMKSLKVEGSILASDSATIVDNGIVRVVVIYDNATNGAAPARGDVFASLASDGSTYTTTSVHDCLRPNNLTRFTTLVDKKYKCSLQDPVIHFKYFIKKQLETTYSGTDSPPTVTKISTGAIFLFVFKENSYTNSPFIQDVNCRLRFYD